MTVRSTHGCYSDPVDLVWLSVARRLGFQIRRSDEAYASFDGRDEITICTDHEFDPDDCLAQMILHEICHALVSGDKGRRTQDWGIRGSDGQDLQYEHAAQRLQAHLSDRFGLREFLAVTTQWRAHYDALGEEPLRGQDPSVRIASQGLENARAWGWEDAILTGLRVTADIAKLVSPFVPEDSLWTVSRPLHPTGFPLEGERICDECVWMTQTSETTLRCQQLVLMGTVAFDFPSGSPSCERFEERFDADECPRCGACCREGFDAVPVSREDPIFKLHPELVEKKSDFMFLPRPNGRCVGLKTSESGSWKCDVYEHRPRSCRELDVGSVGCLQARQRVGLSRN